MLQFRESGFKIWLATNPSGVLTVKKPNYPNYLRAWKLICQVSSSGYFKSEINGVRNYFGESFKKIPDGKFKIPFMHVKPNYFKYVERFYDYYHHIYLPVVNGQANGLQTPNEGINQRNSKCLGQMWQTNMLRPYISKNLGLGVDFRPCSEGDFLTGRQ